MKKIKDKQNEYYSFVWVDDNGVAIILKQNEDEEFDCLDIFDERIEIYNSLNKRNIKKKNIKKKNGRKYYSVKNKDEDEKN